MPPAEFTKSPRSILVWSEQRHRSALLAADLAGSIDRQFEWIQIRDPADLETEAEFDFLQRVDEPRIHWVQAEEMGPDRTGGNVALWMAFRDKTDTPALEHSTRFATLPEPVRQVLSRTDPEGPTRSLVIAHADRAAFQFPDAPGTLRPYLDVLKRSNLCPIFTYGRPPRPNGVDFDVVMQVRVGPPADDGEVVLEQGTSLMGPSLRGSDSLPVAEFLARWNSAS